MKNRSKKCIFIVLLALLILITFQTIAKADATFEEVKNDKRNVEIKVKADKTIKHVFIYKKSSDGKYILFYKKIGENNKECNCIIPEEKLSTETTTDFKIVVVEEDGKRTTGDIKADKLTPYPTMNPEETAKPSWSPTPVPTKPTPTTTTSTSPSGSTSPSTSTSTSTSTQPTGSTSPSTSPTTSADPVVDGKVEVHFIDPNSRVDAIYIKAGNQSAFIDGGFYGDAKAEIAYLKKIGVSHIDYYIGSHGHTNHVGAAGPIIKEFGITNIVCGKAKYGGKPSVIYSAIAKVKSYNKSNKTKKEAELNAINKCKVNVMGVGDTFNIGTMKVTCLGPSKIISGVNPTNDSGACENTNSLVLRFDYGKTSFLMAGDSSAKSSKGVKVHPIKDANNRNPGCIDVDVYNNSHHNSTIDMGIIKLMSPKYVVFTTGPSSLPSSSYLKNLHKLDITTYIATKNRDKNILMTSDGTSLKVKTKN